MTAAERLTAALDAVYLENPEYVIAKDLLAFDPHLAEDIETGRALRELREALPEGVDFALDSNLGRGGFVVDLWRGVLTRVGIHRGPTIAAAADAARLALGEKP